MSKKVAKPAGPEKMCLCTTWQTPLLYALCAFAEDIIQEGIRQLHTLLEHMLEAVLP